ncbi:hypothetical protein R6G85_03950 [Actinotignum urinale]|uniref:Uncharacterized protein n=1 Tax=Actinotignum urinale TaxID=190146 RepID=A0AAW9HV45_9ACTO|nr:hypothetical protein [Actinotignum urinale]MDY5133527.1 hypothetical protein [Actinotignum urinale]MDY5151642.1 hypothetical protein [Actinotignum urinale]MDY5155529.1 hypothetical protein [Actinotignum urinale]WIK59352.1 hypothetical protein CJ184_001500 [Actinotignum urinale]
MARFSGAARPDGNATTPSENTSTQPSSSSPSHQASQESQATQAPKATRSRRVARSASKKRARESGSLEQEKNAPGTLRTTEPTEATELTKPTRGHRNATPNQDSSTHRERLGTHLQESTHHAPHHPSGSRVAERYQKRRGRALDNSTHSALLDELAELRNKHETEVREKTKLTEEKTRLENEKSRLETELAQARDSITELEATTTHLNGELSRLQNEITTHDNTMMYNSGQIKALELSEIRHQEATKRSAQLLMQVRMLENKLTESRRTVADMQRENNRLAANNTLDTATATSTLKASHTRELSALNERYHEALKDADKLREDIAKIRENNQKQRDVEDRLRKKLLTQYGISGVCAMLAVVCGIIAVIL